MASPRRAVVVGVNEYENKEKIPSLKGAVNDATEICDKLRRYGDFEISEQHFLTAEKATSEGVRRAMSDLLWKADSCEVALFYFSGHGFQDGYGNGYIAPYDLNYEEPLVRGIKIQELKELFLASRNKQKALLILDCCHSGIATDGDKDVPGAQAPFYHCLSDVDSGAKGTGRYILASSGADEKSREIRRLHNIRTPGELEHEHGAFTFHLLEGMDAGAADDKAVVTLARLQRYVSDKMQQLQTQHECTFWGFGAGSFDETRIVTACRKQDIDALIQSAAQSLEEGNTEALFAAIVSLRQAVAACPESREASDLKGKINTKLQNKEDRQSLSQWLLENTTQYSRKFRDFSSFERCAARFCFDEIAKLDPKRIGVLGKLLSVAKGECDVDVLDYYLRALESSVTPQVGKATDVKGPA